MPSTSLKESKASRYASSLVLVRCALISTAASSITIEDSSDMTKRTVGGSFCRTNVENLEITGIVGEEKMEQSVTLCQGSWDEDKTEKDPLAESYFPTTWSGSKKSGLS